jgi:3-isopropylmalate/(R)-2-methylmalate dehydratase small subunit
VKPFVLVDGIAAPFPRDNVDTDALIPSRETQSVVRTGYGEKLFANWRYQPGTRIEQPDFVLNREPYRHADLLIAGRNFGCGSSREAAVWSLEQFGIRCVVAQSFGSIFRNNCIRNGVLPVVLDEAESSRLMAQAEQPDARFTVDLARTTIVDAEGAEVAFSIDPLEQEMLLAGLDEVELTLRRREAIEAFQRRDREERPWIWARADRDRA